MLRFFLYACRSTWVCLAAILALTLGANGADAQIEAYYGQPYGVAKVTLPFPPEDVGLAPGRTSFTVTGPAGRVLYPAFNEGVFQRLLGSGAPPRSSLTVTFLFVGGNRFDVTIGTPTPQRVTIVPRAANPRVYSRLVRRWWRDYNTLFRQEARDGESPPLVGVYLTSMLARRLGLEPPLLDRLRPDDQKGELARTIELLAGAERLRLQKLRETNLGTAVSVQPATLPVPPDIRWQRPTPDDQSRDAAIEPIAMHVPEECFYVRFGQFANYLWLNQLLEDYGGDIASMVTARGYQTDVNARIQRQLGLKQSALAEILGPQVISDVAIIGRDTYVREGAALGILFEARNALLGVDLVRQRSEALGQEQENGATDETVNIAGHQVSLVSTPDNRLRSFYAVDGDYHLVTTSRALVERFYAAGQGKTPLGTNAAFRAARKTVPVDRDDTLFAYFSSPFLQGLISPQYQIELDRRMQAVTDIELIKLASMAARAENKPGDTVAQLVSGQLLPPEFAKRADGSGPIVADTQIIDSLRGARGSFVPIPDVTLRGVTQAEADRYAAQAAYYAQNWRQMDPLLVAVKRYASSQKGRERLVIDAFITPLDDTKYGRFMSLLGAPTQNHIVPPAGIVISLEAALRGGLLAPDIPPHTLFLGVLDHVPLADLDPSHVLKVLQIVRTTPGYLGAWPQPGFLDLLPFGLGGQPDAYGFSQLLFGVWRWQGRGFSVLSLDRDILNRASRQLEVTRTDQEAHVRIHVEDLSRTQLSGWINAMGYERSRQASVSNIRLLNLLSQQLHVPRDQAMAVAQDLLDARLVCTLGGRYELVQRQGADIWRSSAWPDSVRYELPADYQTTLLKWFRGLDASLTKYPGRLVVRAQLDMQRRKRDMAAKLPMFDLLGGNSDAPPTKKK